MADNVPITAGSGTNIATDDIGGVNYQRVKISHGADGTATDTSEAAPLPVAAYGELIEAIQALRMAVQSLTRNMGVPDTAGRLRVLAENPTTANLQVTATQTGTWTLSTVNAVTSITQLGGLAAVDAIPALAAMGVAGLRRNISVT